MLLRLKGEAGLPLIHRRYLTNPKATVETYTQRFWRCVSFERLTEFADSPKASIISSFRLVLGEYQDG